MKKAFKLLQSNTFFWMILMIVLASESSKIMWQMLVKVPEISINSAIAPELKLPSSQRIPHPLFWAPQTSPTQSQEVEEIEIPMNDLLDVSSFFTRYLGAFISGKRAVAFISVNKKPSELREIGGKISTATVVSIKPTYLLLKQDEQMGKILLHVDEQVEKLKNKILGKEEAGGDSAQTSNQKASPSASSVQGKKTQAQPRNNVQSAALRPQVDAEILNTPESKKLKKELLSEPLKIVEFVRFQPKFAKNGLWESVKIYPKKKPHIFKALGFLPGDNVVRIEGEEIKEIAKDPVKWQRLLKAGRVELEVEREGITQTIIMDLNQ